MHHTDLRLPSSRREFLKTAVIAGAVAPFIVRAAADAASGGASGGAAASGAVALAPPDKQPPDLKVPVVARKAGWAVVGLGQLALEQSLPAFRECQYSQVVALVSGHPDKARRVAQAYGVDAQSTYGYDNFDQIAGNPAIDVVYIVLPNSMHAEFTMRALKAGKHVLCEKPMAVTVADSEKMIAAARAAGRQLGIAYRLHHEPMNLAVMDLCRKKTLGELRTFTSSNCQDVKAPNIRLSRDLGGGPVGDLGVYSINAARYVLGEEPLEVMAFARQPPDDPRFREVPETVGYVMRYPSGAVATCDCSFGTANSSRYRAVGTKGFVEMDPAFSYEGQKLRYSEQTGEKSVRILEPRLPQVNQFTQEFDHFSQAVLASQPFATPGEIGLADMRIVTAIEESWRAGGRTVKIG